MTGNTGIEVSVRHQTEEDLKRKSELLINTLITCQKTQKLIRSVSLNLYGPVSQDYE